MNQTEVKRRQAGAISEILVWLILLSVGRMTGSNGAAYVTAAVTALLPVWIAAGGGLADSLGRLLRSRNNKGQYKNAERMRSSALLFQLIPGVIGSAFLLFGAEWIAEDLLGVRYSALILMALSPVVLLRTLSLVLLGYFQGEGTDLPTAASDIIRPIFTLSLGLLFSAGLKEYGVKVSGLLMQSNFTAMYGGVGIAAAVSVAEAFVLLFLFVLYKISRRRMRKRRQENGMRTVDSFMDCVRYLCAKRWQGSMQAFLAYLPLPLGWLFYVKSVKEEDIAAAEYGMYVGQYLVLCGILIAFIVIVAMPVAGRTLLVMKREEQRSAKAIFQSGLHISVVHGIFMAVFLAVMAGQFAALLSPSASESVEKMLQGGSATVIFVALSRYFVRLLNATDRKYHVMGALAAADVLYAICTALFLNTGKTGILALVYSGLTASCVLCILLGVFACGQMRLKPDWLRIVLLPLVAGGIAAFLCSFLGRMLAPHLGSPVTLLVTMVVSATVYWAGLLLARDFREQELEHIPGGRILSALGQMLRVF